MDYIPAARIKTESVSVQGYQKLLEAFDYPSQTGKLYPEYYSGAFINQDGKLVVLTRDAPPSIESKITDILKGSCEVLVQPAKHSYNLLTQIMEEINYFLLANTNHPVAQNIAQAALYEDQGCIKVCLNNCTEAAVTACKAVLPNFDLITYCQQEETPPAAPEAGEARLANDKNAITFQAWDRTVFPARIGFITSTQGIKQYDLVEIASGNTLYWAGTCSKFSNGGKVRAAFVPLANDYQVSITDNIYGTSDIISHGTYYPVAGMSVRFAHYTKNSTGTISSINATVSIGGVTYTEQSLANYSVSNGTGFGGLIYHPVHLGSYTSNAIVGSHVGASGSNSVLCRAVNILSTLNIELLPD